MLKKIMAGVLLAALSITAIAPAAVTASGGKNIVERVVALNEKTGSFDTLVAAVVCTPAALDTLSNEALELTVFGPTDRAFRQLGLDPHNVCKSGLDLEDILFYHVIDPSLDLGRVTYREAVSLSPLAVPMANGDTADLKGRWFNLRFETANPAGASNIIIPNIWANNGIIHVVDDVLLP